MSTTQYHTHCSHCGTGMNAGYCIDNGSAYYCTDACLHTVYTPEQWAEMYSDGDGESYWTEWEQPIADDVPEQPEALFHNSMLEHEYNKGAYANQSSLGYVIERDYHNDVYELVMFNQVIAAMNGIEEEGAIVAEYLYQEAEEAEQDIERLQELTGCIFTKE